MDKRTGEIFFIVVIFVFIGLQQEQLQSASEVDMRNPVRSAAQDEICTLPGLNYTPNFKQYSGYLAADKTNNRFLHYWLVESQSRPSEDPLVLWLNGGPGCSSLYEVLKDLGPFLFDDKREQLFENKFAWNQHANILFLESPAGVGYSYAADGNITTNDYMTAKGNYQALISFFDKFPQFTNRSLYLTGQSYAGVYIPMLANLVDNNKTMNLKGISVGNGHFNIIMQSLTKFLFARYHGLIGSSRWNNFLTNCCNNKLDQRGLCEPVKVNATIDSQACINSITQMVESIDNPNINLYNIYAECDSRNETDNVVSRRKRSNFAGARLNLVDQMVESVTSLHHGYSSNDLPCDARDDILATYLNGKLMRDALHIPKQLSNPFKMCWDEKQQESYDRSLVGGSNGGMNDFFLPLMKSHRRLKILIYNGDFDWVCDFIGAEWFVDNLNDTLVTDHSPWFVGNRLAGFVKQFEHITLMTVRGAGHSVPKDKPAEALHLFEKYLLNLPRSSGK